MAEDAQFHAERKEKLGSTDSAAVLGVHPYKNAFDVWIDKTSEEHIEKEQSLRMWLGTQLQESVAQLYTASTGVECHRDEGWYTQGVLGAHVDYEDAHGDLVECKTTRSTRGWGPTDTEEIPRHIWIQVQHQMACLPGVKQTHVAVLFGHDDFRIYTIKRNQTFIDTLASDMTDWWNAYVITKQAPPVDGSGSAGRYLRTLYPTHTGDDLLPATADLSAVAHSYLTTRTTIEELEQVQEGRKQIIMAAIKDKAGAFGAGWKARWKANKSSVVTDWKNVAGAYRMLVKDQSEDQLNAVVSMFTEIKAGNRPFIIEAVEGGDEGPG